MRREAPTLSGRNEVEWHTGQGLDVEVSEFVSSITMSLKEGGNGRYCIELIRLKVWLEET